MTFVDTNYFVRYLLNDINQQHLKAKELFSRGAQGKEYLITSVIVVFEIYWLFTSFYNKQKVEVYTILKNILSMAYIDFEQGDLLTEALETFKNTNLDLEDCYNFHFAKVGGITKYSTFDKDLTRIWDRKS